MKLQAIIFLVLQLVFELSTCRSLRVISGSSLEIPCLSFQTDIMAADITWSFNGEVINPDDKSSSSVRVIKGGLYLSISPVTPANEGSYVCLVTDDNTEMIGTHNITVDASYFITIKATEGSTFAIPCHFPPSVEVTANALWFRETIGGERTKLNLQDDAEGENKKLEQLYPLDQDQSILLRHVAHEDAGLYHCESAEGAKLTTVYVIVKDAPSLPSHSCAGFTAPWEECRNENSHTEANILQESTTEFALKLYSFLRHMYPSSNLLFSPISISGLLSHLLLGARNVTRRALEGAVFVPHDFHCLHFQMKKLREKLSGSLQMASQIYYNPQMNLSESFTNQSIQFYDSEPTKLLASGEESARMINTWVASKTNNKITQLVESVSPDAQLILLNAVSFSGQWKGKFDPKPRKAHFTKLNGDLVKVPILYHETFTATMMHSVDLKAQVARFALTGNSSLYVLLPRTGKAADLQQVEEKMTDTAVREMIEQMKATAPQQMEVTLPQITLDVTPDMNILIKKLGLSSLFEGANLCGLYAEEKLVLDEARHRAFLALTERGVEAGAVTSLSFSRSFPSFRALRPFILLLWSDQASVPLFIGRVTDPSVKE
ncbi:plasma protease C1 inhibitor [Salarias fasciatus]|uniref:plasma protease C1 inhibitor n=1 Tax=Salarias fasciatus TaxID=181472 RepID=UPI0011768C70|nr:plasma protease C1 inhibitor-like [Salarias fasciatus]